jgi:hypothetical protein
MLHGGAKMLINLNSAIGNFMNIDATKALAVKDNAPKENQNPKNIDNHSDLDNFRSESNKIMMDKINVRV